MPEIIRVGIDTGGTFTDFVVARGSNLISFKLPSTPRDPAEAIVRGVARIIEETSTLPSDVIHGTTVATNALLERKGARTALITTAGFEDVIEIGRQARPELYNLNVVRPDPLVPARLRFGVKERIGPDGAVIESLDTTILDRIAAALIRGRVESVAVCLLFSFANPDHEQRIARRLEATGLPLSLSHVILPEYREYERTSTVVINAYLLPLMSRYLGSLVDRIVETAGSPRDARRRSVVTSASRSEGRNRGLRGKGVRGGFPLRVMQSNGGSVSASTAAAEPVRAILSGPAGGVVGALRVCSLAGARDILTFDMGGTSTDVALCRGGARTTNEATIAGLPVAVPVIDIHTVGAGGGSIAFVDPAGALRVGPESAGAEPGPACYGRGDRPTVTDANLVLGRFGGAELLGGEMCLDVERARKALAVLADEMSRFSAGSISVEEAADGVIRVANANMERALRVVSVERGQDPRLFTLVSFGGAGGLHVCALADALRIPRVIVPRSPGTLSALGVLLGDVVKDYSRTVMLKAAGVDSRSVEAEFRSMRRRAERDLAQEGFTARRARFARSAALRYIGQSFEIDVPWTAGFERRFHVAHRERYGYADSTRPVEIVSLKLRATGVTSKPSLKRFRESPRSKPPRAGSVTTWLEGNPRRTPVYRRDDLKAGTRLLGPAVISEYSSTTLLPPRKRLRVDAWLNLVIE